MEESIREEKVAFVQPIGKILLLEKVFVQSKLRVHLKRVFSADELAMIQVLVFYLVSEDNQLWKANNWLMDTYAERNHLSFEAIKNLLKTLNKSRQNLFFESWEKTRKQDRAPAL